MVRPVVVNPDMCKPLPENQRGSACKSCGEPRAKWLFGEDPHPICSLCFLYKTFWGQNRVDEIAEMVLNVEKEMGTRFLRDDDGHLISERDATRIASAVLLTSHLLKSSIRSQHRRDAMDYVLEKGTSPSDALAGEAAIAFAGASPPEPLGEPLQGLPEAPVEGSGQEVPALPEPDSGVFEAPSEEEELDER